MTSERAQRRLTAILSADAVGYSRLMAADEEGTAATLASCRHLLSDLNRRSLQARGHWFKSSSAHCVYGFHNFAQCTNGARTEAFGDS